MIFVILGTQDKPFTRLLKKIESLKKDGNIKEDIIIQAGYTKYESDCMKIFDYMPIDEFNNNIKKADLIITHAGAGSILSSLKENKKVIAVPRLSKYGEHTNDHQIQITEELSNEGYILGCQDLNKLKEVIKESKTFKPKEYKANNDKMINIIDSYIEAKNNKNHSLIILLALAIIFILLIYIICK